MNTFLKTNTKPASLAVVLVGHGSPATDCPPELVGELMSLEWHSGPSSAQGSHHARAAELDAKIRNWPRHSGNDPYKTGLERLGETLRPFLPTDRLIIAYNEFCSPSISQAIDQAVQLGAGKILVISSMVTPGGIHSEKDIPRDVERSRQNHPGISIEYLWPFDLRQVAELFASHIQRAISQTA